MSLPASTALLYLLGFHEHWCSGGVRFRISSFCFRVCGHDPGGRDCR